MVETIYTSKRKAKYCNCVFYARRKVPSLPYGLWTIRNKIAIINKTTPKKDRVAIIRTGRIWGHVAVVTSIGKDGRIRIKEANWRSCRKTIRKGTARQLNIVGYYRG